MKRRLISIIIFSLIIFEAVSFSNVFAENSLGVYSGVHPRVFFSSADFNRMKGETGSGYMKKMWTVIKNAADYFASTEPPRWEDKNSGENNWIVAEGEKLSTLCFAYKMTSDPTYKTAADNYASILAGYPVWGTEGGINNQLAGRGPFVGFAVYYDWLYDDLTTAQKSLALSTLSERGSDMAGGNWWRVAYLQNHMITCWGSLFAAAAAIYDDYPDAENWFPIISNALDRTLALFPEDSGGYEGHTYWGNTMRSLNMYAILSDKFLNTDIRTQYADLFKNAAYWGIYNSLPLNGQKSLQDQFNFADAATYSYYEIPDFAAYAAAKSRDGYIQKYVHNCVDKLSQYTSVRPTLFWETMGGYDSTLSPESLEELPLNRIFSDTGFIYLRSGFGGNESVVSLRCGSPMGNKAAEYMKTAHFEVGIGHQHPDINSPVIYANGEWLLKDDGYVTGATSNHSTLLVNGVGQLGDINSISDNLGIAKLDMYALWYQSKPYIAHYEENNDYTYIAADGTDAYPAQLGLTKFRRHFIYMKKQNVLYITDECEASEEKNFELRFRPTLGAGTLQSDGSYLYNGTNSYLRLTPIGSGGTVANENLPYYSAKNKLTTYDFITEKKTASKWIQANILSWGTTAPEQASGNVSDDGSVVFASSGSFINLDTKSMTVEMIPVNASYNSETRRLNIKGYYINSDEPIKLKVYSENKTIYQNNINILTGNSFEKNIFIGENVENFTVEVTHTENNINFTKTFAAGKWSLSSPECVLDENEGIISISGITKFDGSDKRVSVKITSPSGKILYVGETDCDMDGEYSFNVSVSPLERGDYTVEVYSRYMDEMKTVVIEYPKAPVPARAEYANDGNYWHYTYENKSAVNKTIGIIAVKYSDDMRKAEEIRTAYETIAPGDITDIVLSNNGFIDFENDDYGIYIWDDNLSPISAD